MPRISATELAHLMLTQKACFNSPVWFNVGVKEENRGYGWFYDEQTDAIQKLTKSVHEAAVLGMLHQCGEGFAGIDPGPGEDRGHAVQVGFGHGDQPVGVAGRERDAVGRRAGFGPAVAS